MLIAKRRYLDLAYGKLILTLYTVLEAHEFSRGREEMLSLHMISSVSHPFESSKCL